MPETTANHNDDLENSSRLTPRNTRNPFCLRIQPRAALYSLLFILRKTLGLQMFTGYTKKRYGIPSVGSQTLRLAGVR
jgi:hypothetical protein